MPVSEVVELLGGVASGEQLRRHVSRRALREAVARGTVVRVARGRFALPGAERAAVAAAERFGQLACLSAAEAAGFELLEPPDRPWIAVARNRSRVDDRGVHLIYSDERETDPVTLVMTCARRLPWAQALAVADSALRSGQVEKDELVVAAARVRGAGAAVCRRVAAAASAAKTNPIESALHSIALDVPGLHPEPQVAIDLSGLVVHPDLVDLERRIAIEADSWLYHASTPEAFERDVRRYTMLTVHRWRVARFTPHHVRRLSDEVHATLVQLVADTPTGKRRVNQPFRAL